ncbi:MAG: phenylalanine--tRNA ligase subunit beta [Thermoleophilaceae bacterium]
MRVPVSWLRAYCDPGLSTAEIVERLDMSGTETERVERVGVGSVDAFVVGRVITAERHPDADRLSVCTVDTGNGHPRTIVCGAPNVAAGQTVAVALPGAVMPDGSELGEAKLRGVESSGMILAEDEVGVGEDHGGIMVLPGDAPVGAPLVEHLQIADEVIEFEITPNRPDCLGIYGIARELHAATGAALKPIDEGDPDVEPAEVMPVEIDPEICLRFTVRVFEDVKIGPSPLWLKARLSAAGQRPISNVVDITNYVMLLTGQPLHAFDLDRVRGGKLAVHQAAEGDTLTTLDDVERKLSAGMALISDAEGPTSLAGIMGGQVSEVHDDTARVAMEAATWVGPNILQTSKALTLRSEASGRFEKQLHPDQAVEAQKLAARLMVDLCGARAVPGMTDVYPQPAEPRVLRLRLARLKRLLGEEIPQADVRAILERLDFGVAGADGGFDVTVPGFRDADVQREADLVEEVARIHGLEKLPITLPARERAVGRLTPSQRLRRRLEDALRDRGLHEVVAYSFTRPEALAALQLGDVPLLRLANPLSEDQSVMRPLLLPGLLDAARHNAAHDMGELRLFESAHVYRPSGSLDAPEGSPRGADPAMERHHVGALITQAAPGTWRSEARGADFYAAKGLLEGVLGALGIDWWMEEGERPFLHPGRAATLLAGDERTGSSARTAAGTGKLGWVGELHPLVARAWDLEGAAAFELDADLLAEIAPGPARFADVTSFPAVFQDIAVVVPEELPAAEVEAAVRAGGGELLSSTRVFDVYRGDQVGEGAKSLALRLEFRAPDRTLTEDEVAGLRGHIESELAKVGGRLRA